MTEPSLTPTLKADHERYHHIIPRFILRRFQVGGQMSKKERKKAFKYTGREPGEDIRTRYPFDVNHLDERLSRLESNAADVVLQVHKAIDKGSFAISRQKLGDLRQFLFLMRYHHTVALSASDANTDHPKNTFVAEQLKRFGESLALSTNSQIWLHFLHYFLDVQTYDGAPFTNRQDMASHTDPKPRNVGILAHIPAAIYQRHARMFYLANGLGLWEGLSEQCHMHCVFVVGPHLAIILRNNVSMVQMDDSFTFDITKLTSQQTFDVNSFLLRNEHDDGSITFTSKEFMMKTLAHYVDTTSTLEDPHKNPAQPNFSLSHRLKGAFGKAELDPEAGLSSSTEPTSSHSAATAAGPHTSPPRSKRSKKRNPRIAQLARSGTETLTPLVPRPSGSSRDSVSENRNGPVAGPFTESHTTPYSDQHTDALDELMIRIISRQISFFSSYEQAYRLYNLFVAVQPPANCDRILSEIISRLQEILRPPNRDVRPRPNASSPVPHPREDQKRWALLVNPKNGWEEMYRGVVKNRPDVLAATHFT
ncbi:hypothetical protein IW261DRAFT_1511349 [Armillaria novae-zelandiae]|uniref:Uncharacterized protein n=1 Tax=Armillaria novae-zelandiae TaxID=153914 RepID=A0AA39NTG2_9AGAR|nr:hypothetical protein IW261DRAFT_1511349 [Armillaria novae-zelandiae]